MPKHTKKFVRSSRKTLANRTPRGKVDAAAVVEDRANQVIHREAERIKALLAKNDSRNALAKYAIATRVKLVIEYEAQYGKSAVVKLGALLGLDSKLLYRWAGVAEVWPTKAAFRKVACRENKFGIALTWSHFEVLAEKANSDGARERFLTMALAEGLSVRELREHIGGSPKKLERAVDQASPATSEEDPLVEISKNAERDAAALARCREMLKTKPVWSAEDAAAAERAQARIEAMIEEGAATVEEIKKRLVAARQPSTTAPASALAVAPAEVV